MENSKLDEVYAGMRKYIEALGYDCAGFELTSENDMNILRAYVDMPGGIDLADCEKVAREVTDYLDTVEKELPERYYLEVSSPGLERPLFTPDDYNRFAGREVRLTLKNGKKVVGTIARASVTELCLTEEDATERTIPFVDVRKGHLVYKEEQGQKKTFKKAKKKK